MRKNSIQMFFHHKRHMSGKLGHSVKAKLASSAGELDLQEREVLNQLQRDQARFKINSGKLCT